MRIDCQPAPVIDRGADTIADDVAGDVAFDVICVDGTALLVRPIEIDDAARLERMFGRLSPASIRFRFFSPLRMLPPATLSRLSDVDHDRREALVALDGDEIVAVARYDASAVDADAGGPASREVEIAVTVDDEWQHRGVGTTLTGRLAALARRRGFDALFARILPENRAAIGLLHKIFPDATARFAGGDYTARVPLHPIRPERSRFM